MFESITSVRYPLFFLGLFIIEIGGLLYHFLGISENALVVFAALGFIVYFISIALPRPKKE